MYLRMMKATICMILALGLAGTATAIAPQMAYAAKRPRVVVLPFSGPGAKPIRATYIRGIRRRTKVLPLRAFRKIADRLGVPAEAALIPQICAELRCHAVVEGSTDKRGRRYRVQVVIYNGLDGTVIGEPDIKTRGRRPLRRAAGRLGKASLKYLRRGSLPTADVAPPSPGDDGRPPWATGDDEAPPPLGGEAPGGADEQAAELAQEGEEAAEEEEKPATAGGLSGLFSLQAALGSARRRFVLSGADPSENSEYQGGFFPEFTISAEVYPLVLLTGNFLRNIGIGASYNRHITNSTKDPVTGSSVDSASQEILVELRYRWPIWQTPTSPVVVGLAGWGIRSFDLEQNPRLTSFAYQFFRVGLEGYVPILTPLVAVAAGFDLRPLLRVGQEAVDSYGARDGGFGWSARGGLRGDLPFFGLYYSAMVEYLSFSTDFAGLDPADIRPATHPDRDEPTSASDKFLRFWGAVGYAL